MVRVAVKFDVVVENENQLVSTHPEVLEEMLLKNLGNDESIQNVKIEVFNEDS